MPSLSYYTNVHSTTANVAKKKGFRVWREWDEGVIRRYWAEKDGWDFCAKDPVQLSGLIAIFETVSPEEWKEYWWSVGKPGAPDLPDEAPEYTPVYARK